MDVICVLSLLSPPSRLSFVSVVFDFNASLNDVAPIFSIRLSAHSMRMEIEFVYGYLSANSFDQTFHT